MIEISLRLAFFNASEERISAITDRANTDWIMIDHSTICIYAARAYAWILASLIDARCVRATIRADYAFWSARRWTANVIRLTGAYCVIIDNAAVAVRSTGRWLARITWYWRLYK